MSVKASGLSAAECLFLLEPNSGGRDTLKVALKELVARSVLRFEVRQVKRFFGGLREEVSVRVERQPVLENRVLAELHRALVSAVGSGTTLAKALTELRSRYGIGYAGFHDGLVIASLLRAGLVARQQVTFLWIFRRQIVRPNAIGLRRQAELREKMDRARDELGREDGSPAELAALAASLGALVILMPDQWPHWRRIEQGLHQYDALAESLAEFEWSVDLDGFDQRCSDVDAAVDSGDGGDGGGDGGGD